jgi:arylsulfatase A-like enzyme
MVALLALGFLFGACGRPAEEPRGDVVLVILDTTRADHLSAYGYLRGTTPQLERLAAEGRVFENAWAQAPWTLPAIATILTGQPPWVNGAGGSAAGMHSIRPGVATLAERMTAAGYRSAAFINVIWCSPRISRLDRGFELYDFATSDETNRGQRDAAATTRAALDWVRGAGDDPVFLVVHYFDPHLTYDPPAPFDTLFEEGDGPRVPRGFGAASEVFAIRKGEIRLDRSRRKSLVARYDGELLFTDEQFGELRRGLERLGRWERSLVVVVGDHGEEFWDHGGFEHGHSHHRELLRVPLIVKRPGGPRGEVRSERVRQIEIAPTVLGFAGIALPAELPGFVLGAGEADVALGEGTLWAGDLVSARSDAGTQFLYRDSGETRFYAADDPLEQHPRDGVDNADPVLLRLLRALPTGSAAQRQPVELTDEQREKLRSLGYLQ